MNSAKKTVPNFSAAVLPEKAELRRRRYELGHPQIEAAELEAAIEIAKADPKRTRQAWESMAERIDEINATLKPGEPELYCMCFEIFSIIIDPAPYRDGFYD